MKKKERLSIDLNEEEICQRCEHANVCWIYARVHNEDIRVFEDRARPPRLRVKIVLCDFFKPRGRK